MTHDQLTALRAQMAAQVDYPTLLRRLAALEQRVRDVEDDQPYERDCRTWRAKYVAYAVQVGQPKAARP